MPSRSEYLKFVDVDAGARKTRVVEVRSERSNAHLGTIAWYSHWRQYTFSPQPETIFNTGCLEEIANELVRMTQQHRDALIASLSR